MAIAGGEGQGASEVEEAMAHLLVCLGARGDDRRGLVGDGVRTAAKVSDGEGSPVRDWWRGVGF